MKKRPKLTRRSFVSLAAGIGAAATTTKAYAEPAAGKAPLFVSTWPFGKPANEKALATLKSGSSLLDAVEQGIRLTESDADNTSVGIGGIPNAEGVVQLDACIMDGPEHRCGSVAAIEGIAHPITAARRVMEKTPHVLLVGDGAKKFALQQGLEPAELLTEKRLEAWRKWREENHPADNHDTIALVGLGTDGNLAGGCSTSGYGYKLPGRVGDSPIIGSGLYVDNEVGAAGSTGLGENVMRFCASFMVVENMRAGMSPEEACIATIKRVAKMDPTPAEELYINFIAIDKQGRYGAAGTGKGFEYAVTTGNSSRVLKSAIAP
ncbi:MAG: N4-(beta-N-acetylglucosaminyl)-L-asparaginase [Verrucomicrobiales bacterium]|jgi:N4-(beta-N-acetylglucosaminyl)-L-asparaginase